MSEVNANLIIRGFDKTQDAFKSLDRNLGESAKRTKELQKSFENITAVSKKMAIAGGVVFGAGALAIKKFTTEAMEAERVTATFQAMSKSIGSDTVTAIEGLRKSTRGLVNDTDLMKAGNKFMAMGLASNTEEMNKLSEMATKLGSAMGNDATSSMENFALMLANQSVMRLDSFGISSGKVRERIEELMATTEGMTRETAFMTATMEQGEASMAKLGDTALTNGEKMQAFQARMANLRNQLGDALIPILQQVYEKIAPVVEAVVGWIEKNPELSAKILMVVTALGGLLLVIGSIGLALVPIMMALSAFGTVLAFIFSPIGLIIGALALLGYGLYQLYQNWDTVWSGIKNVTAIAGEFVMGIFETIKGFFASLGEGIVNMAKAWYEWNKPLQMIVATVQGIILVFDILLHVVMGLFILAMPYIQAGIDAIKGAFASMRDAVMPYIDAVRNAISIGFVGTLNVLNATWQAVWQGMVTFFSPIIDAIGAKFDAFATKAKSVFDSMKAMARDFANFFIGIGEGIGNAWVTMVNAIIGALNKIQINIPDWVPKYGGRSFGINIAKASEVSIPRLAEGGIATKSTLANIGEAGPEAIIPLSKLHQFGGVGQTIVVNIDTMVGTDEFAESMGDRFVDILKRNQILTA